MSRVSIGTIAKPLSFAADASSPIAWPLSGGATSRPSIDIVRWPGLIGVAPPRYWPDQLSVVAYISSSAIDAHSSGWLMRQWEHLREFSWAFFQFAAIVYDSRHASLRRS